MFEIWLRSLAISAALLSSVMGQVVFPDNEDITSSVVQAIKEGLEEADKGKFVSDSKVRKFFSERGIIED